MLIGLRDAIVEQIDALFTAGPVHAFKHRGKWTVESIKHYAAKTPCIAIAYTGASGWESTGNGKTRGYVALTAFVITEEADGDEDDASLALTQLLLTLVPGNNWGLEDVSVAESVDGLNAYTHKLDDKGVNIHAVSWVHDVSLSKLGAAEIAALPDFLRLHTTMLVGGEADPDAEHLNNVREE